MHAGHEAQSASRRSRREGGVKEEEITIPRTRGARAREVAKSSCPSSLARSSTPGSGEREAKSVRSRVGRQLTEYPRCFLHFQSSSFSLRRNSFLWCCCRIWRWRGGRRVSEGLRDNGDGLGKAERQLKDDIYVNLSRGCSRLRFRAARKLDLGRGRDGRLPLAREREAPGDRILEHPCGPWYRLLRHVRTREKGMRSSEQQARNAARERELSHESEDRHGGEYHESPHSRSQPTTHQARRGRLLEL